MSASFTKLSNGRNNVWEFSFFSYGSLF